MIERENLGPLPDEIINGERATEDDIEQFVTQIESLVGDVEPLFSTTESYPTVAGEIKIQSERLGNNGNTAYCLEIRHDDIDWLTIELNADGTSEVTVDDWGYKSPSIFLACVQDTLQEITNDPDLKILPEELVLFSAMLAFATEATRRGTPPIISGRQRGTLVNNLEQRAKKSPQIYDITYQDFITYQLHPGEANDYTENPNEKTMCVRMMKSSDGTELVDAHGGRLPYAQLEIENRYGWIVEVVNVWVDGQIEHMRNGAGFGHEEITTPIYEEGVSVHLKDLGFKDGMGQDEIMELNERLSKWLSYKTLQPDEY